MIKDRKSNTLNVRLSDGDFELLQEMAGTEKTISQVVRDLLHNALYGYRIGKMFHETDLDRDAYIEVLDCEKRLKLELQQHIHFIEDLKEIIESLESTRKRASEEIKKSVEESLIHWSDECIPIPTALVSKKFIKDIVNQLKEEVEEKE